MRRISILLIAAVAIGCASTIPRPQVPSVPVPPIIEQGSQIAIFTVDVEPQSATVRVGSREWVSPIGKVVEQFTAGETYAVTVRAPGYVPQTFDVAMTAGRMEPRKITLAAVPAPPVPMLTVQNKKFYLQNGTRFIPRFMGLLSVLTLYPEAQATLLDGVVARGFNGVRFFAGALEWAGDEGAGGWTADQSVAALPAFLDLVAARGLVAEATALTDTGTGYDAKEHVRRIASVLAGRRGVLLELMNEIQHSSQDQSITPSVLRAWGAELVTPLGIPWAVGALAGLDEVCPPDPWVQDDGSIRARPSECLGYGDREWPAAGGTWNSSHLNRDRGDWNEYRRVRELYEIPALNNEPKGCAEPGTVGQRYYDPAAAFTLGALDRAFGIGGVHHSQAGVLSQIPGPVQLACQVAYVAAHAAVDEVLPGVVGDYKNVGHGGSPLSDARFVDGGSADGVVRAYSFISGDKGVTVLVGAKGDSGLVWANGWRLIRTVASRTAQDGRQVAVLEIGR